MADEPKQNILVSRIESNIPGTGSYVLTDDNSIHGLSINGKVITFTKGDGVTSDTITTQDTVTTVTVTGGGNAITDISDNNGALTATKGATFAPAASPALTGTPTAPTAAVGTNTTQIATTAFVKAEIGAQSVFGASGSDHSKGLVPDPGSTAGTTKFLREDGAWEVPTASNDEAKSAIALAFTELSDLIQYLAFTTVDNNAVATVEALENAIEVLDVDNYRISKSLTGCTLSNNANYITKNGSYTSTIKFTDPSSEVSSISILMGGSNITGTAWDDVTGTISIASVTGTLAITVVADDIVLPSGYTRLQYVEGTGTQYFDTGVTEGEASRAKYDISVTEQVYRKGNHILSSRNTYFPYFRTTSNNEAELGAMHRGNETPLAEESKLYNWVLNQRYSLEGIFTSANGDCKVNGQTIYTLSRGGSSTSTSHLYAFTYAYSSNQDFKFRGRVYAMSIYGANNTPLRRLIPAKNSSDIAGLYDIVNDVFYTSNTDTDFVAGGVV